MEIGISFFYLYEVKELIVLEWFRKTNVEHCRMDPNPNAYSAQRHDEVKMQNVHCLLIVSHFLPSRNPAENAQRSNLFHN